MAEKIPRALFEKSAFLKNGLVAKDEVEITRITDYDARWKGRDRDVKRFVAGETFATGEPRKETLTRLEE